LHVVGWPNKELVLPPQPFRVLRAKNLTGGKVAIQQSANGISISIAAEDRDPVDTIIQFDVDQAVTSLAP
jgi:alpha-L-fucosidase